MFSHTLLKSGLSNSEIMERISSTTVVSYISKSFGIFNKCKVIYWLARLAANVYELSN